MLNDNARIAIIGGGLGGLTAAIALNKIAGIQATVFEQSRDQYEVGAGVTIAPNASRVYDQLGILDRLKSVGATPEATGVYADAMGNVVTDAAWKDTAGQYKNLGMYRPDYLDMLTHEVGLESIRFSHKAVLLKMANSGVRIQFDNGEEEEVDAVIGADGVHSVVRDAIGQHREPVYSKYIIYRGVIDSRALPPSWPKISKTWMGYNRHLMQYPLRSDHSLFNYAIYVPSNGPLKDHTQGTAGRSEIAADFGLEEYDWDPAVHHFVSLIDKTFWWRVFDLEPLSNWSQGPIALLGDSAHCMMPTQGQGVNMAAEDSITLAYFLKEADEIRDIPTAFKRYTAVRMQRTSILQNHSRLAALMFDAQKQFGDVRKRDVDISSGRDFRRRFVFDYDALKVAEKAFERFQRD